MPQNNQEQLAFIEESIEHGEYEAALKAVNSLMKIRKLSIAERIQCSVYESAINLKMGEILKANYLVEEIFKNSLIKEYELSWISILIIKAELSWRLGNISDGLEAVRECESLVERLSPTISGGEALKLKKLQSEISHQGGVLYWYSGDLDRALTYHQHSLEINQELGNIHGVAKVFNNIGLVFASKGDLDSALANYQQALPLMKECGFTRGIAQCLNNMGIVYTMQGDLDRALSYHQESLQIKEQLGNQQEIVMQMINIGVIYQFKGELTRSLDQYQQAYNISEKLGLKKEIALALNNIANIHELRGNLNLALEHTQRSLVLYQEAGMKQDVALCFLNLGEVFRKKGDFDDALIYLKKSLSIYTHLKNDLLMVTVLHKLIDLANNLENPKMGQHYFHMLESIKERVDNKVIEQRYRVAKAVLLKHSKHLRDRVDAVDMLEQVVGDEILDHALSIDATVLLCDYLLTELKMTGDEDVFQRIKSLTDRLLKIATDQASHSLLVETYLLQSKLALVELDMYRAIHLLAEAKTVAEEKELDLLALTITRERNLVQGLMTKWTRILKDDLTKQEMTDVAGVDHLLERMIKKTVADILQVGAVSGAGSPNRKYRLVYLDSIAGSTLVEKDTFRVGIAQIGVSQAGDIINEFYQERIAGLLCLREDKIPCVEENLKKIIQSGVDMGVDLLIFPELSIDLAHSKLHELLLGCARQYQLYIIPGSYHHLESKRNISAVISPQGILWEQEKFIPAIIHLEGKRVTEGIETNTSTWDITIGNTRFGRIAIVICRDFLDMDLRVELKHADPPIDLIINPAFTPVTADFRAAHFDARRSIYAYCFFANIAEFGDSLIYTPEKERVERSIRPREEKIITKDIDLFKLRSERKLWERDQLNQRSFIQSTR